MILVIAGALDLERFAVKKEALVGIEDSRADSERDTLGIARLAVSLDGDDGRYRFGSSTDHSAGFASLAVAV